MSDFKDRLKQEFSDLQEKCNKLKDFIDSNKFDEIDKIQQSLLQVQFGAMLTYATCLHERIENL